MVTYMLLGAKGVQEFKEAGKVKREGILKTYIIHCAPEPNFHVHEWLKYLDTLASPITMRLLTLVRDLLQLEPAERPRATTVTSRLQLLALSS